MMGRYRPIHIGITGIAGEGKTETAKALQFLLNVRTRYSAGDCFREIARARRLTPAQLEEVSRDDPRVDFEIDGMTTDLGQEEDSLIFDGRMVWQCLPRAFNVLLTCRQDIRVMRIARRSGQPLRKVMEETVAREQAARDRFTRFYGIKRFDDPANFSLVVDTSARTVYDTTMVIAQHLKPFGHGFWWRSLFLKTWLAFS